MHGRYNMKHRLYLRGIFTIALTAVITAVIVLSVMSVFLHGRSLEAAFGGIVSQSAVIRDNEVVYSTFSLNNFDKKRLEMSVRANEKEFSCDGVEYMISGKTHPDGTVLVTMSASVDAYSLARELVIIIVLIFAAVYIITSAAFQMRNNEDFADPLKNLIDSTRRLAEGELDINIPDEGAAEVNELCKEIETLRLRLSREVFENQKATDNRKFLVSSISHDLRTPITSLRGYLEGIADGVADTEDKRQIYLQKSIEKINLINSMINDLLLYSKLDMNQVEFRYQIVDCAEYVGAIADEARESLANGKKIVFENNLGGDVCIRIDIKQFERVMGNIVSNAVKYVDEKNGEIRITLRENRESVIIETADNGIGISKDDLPRIFDRFYRCEKSRDIRGSSGLGLAISKQIVETMGGSIWAVSTEGEGTSLFVSLKKYRREGIS